jgi:hypothetical protein
MLPPEIPSSSVMETWAYSGMHPQQYFFQLAISTIVKGGTEI